MKNFLVIPIILVSSLMTYATNTINGAGSTFAEPIYSRWFSDFQKKEKNLQFNYQGIGSGAGIKQLLAGVVDFAGSDDPMSADDIAKSKFGVLHIPMAMGAVVVTYNLDLKKPLRLSGSIIAKIFNGQIKKWNDKEIKQLNSDIQLPDLPITVVTRSDGSGTTAVFSEYLSKESPDWVGKNGKTVNWFAGSLGAKGNAGVAGMVKQNPGTIGYVELIYALENKMPFALVKNKQGEFIEASANSVSIAAQGIIKEVVKKDFKVSITDSINKGAYPISAFTWLLVYNQMPKTKGSAIVQFAKWALSDEAQKTASAINYAPVPKEIRSEALKSLGNIKLN